MFHKVTQRFIPIWQLVNPLFVLKRVIDKINTHHNILFALNRLIMIKYEELIITPREEFTIHVPEDIRSYGELVI